MIGAHDDDLASAEHAGRLQLQSALSLLDRPEASGTPLTGPLRGRVEHRDFATLPVNPRFAGGQTGLRTRPARYGLAMAHGTREGPGPLYDVRWLHSALHGAKRALGFADPQIPFVEVGKGLQGKLLGLISQDLGLALGHVDASVDFLRMAHEAGALGDLPWTPRVLPLQLLTLGPFAIVGIPAEPTTVAGRRIAALVQSALDCTKVLVNGYANGYVSYITTPQEYAVQAYEGASCHFGPWTLPGVMTALSQLCQADLAPAPGASVLGPKLPALDLAALTRQREAGERARGRKRLLNDLLGASS